MLFDIKPPFNHIRIFHNIGEFPFGMNFNESDFDQLIGNMTFKSFEGLMFILFPILLWKVNFFDRIEMEKLKKVKRLWKEPRKIICVLKESF